MPPNGPYDPDNTGADGDYIVGKGRPPENGKFRKGDGRRRGRRPKGTRNLATDFREELDGCVPVTVGGVTKKVTRQQAVVKRLTDNAMKGQNAAIAAVFDLEQRLVAPLRRRDEQRKQAERKVDVERLSRDELRILQFLALKMNGESTENSCLQGVMPIYKKYGQPYGDTREAPEGAERALGESGGAASGVPEAGPDEP